MRYKEKFRLITKFIIIAFFWLAVWQVLYRIVDEPLFLAGPREMLQSLAKLLSTGSTYGVVLKSVAKILGGFLTASLFAVCTAFLAWSAPVIREGLTPLMSFAKAVPIASVIILFLAWFSSSGISVFVAGFVAFPMIYFEVLSALDDIDRKLLEMLWVYRVPPVKRIRYVYFPAVCDRLIQSARIAVGMCIRAGVAAELIGVPAYSVGEKLDKAKRYLEIADLFAWTVIIVAVGYVCEKALVGILGMIGHRAGCGYDRSTEPDKKL